MDLMPYITLIFKIQFCKFNIKFHFYEKSWMNVMGDNMQTINYLTHWGGVTRICVSKLTIIALDNGLATEWRQAIIWTNVGILLIGPLGQTSMEPQSKFIHFSFKKMHLKCHLQNSVYFVSASMSQYYGWFLIIKISYWQACLIHNIL